MILRLFTLISVVVILGALYLILPQGAGLDAFQAVPAKSSLPAYVKEGLFPDPDSLSENESLGHAVFEEPAEDEVRIAAARAAMSAMPGMSGMQMSGMPMGSDGAMQMSDGETMPMGGDGAMQMSDGEAMPMGESAEAHMDASMTQEEAHDEDEESMGGDGLRILAADAEVDREIEITMREWGYSLSDLEVQPGERIRLTIRNDGEIPHEFMFMPMVNMQAIRYRLERADWNLLEHDAPYERSLVMPGQSFQVAIRIETPGVWMFMCMFPYHMQFGMMGQMATPGMSMKM